MQSAPQTGHSMYASQAVHAHPPSGGHYPSSSHSDYQSRPPTHQHHSSLDGHPSRPPPPPEPVEPPTLVTTPTPPPLTAKPSFGTTLPPLSTSFPQTRLEAASSASSTASHSAYSNSLSTPTDTHKRAYGSTFPTSWQTVSSKQGARPTDVSAASNFLAADVDADDSSDCLDHDKTRYYKRACGITVERQMP